MHSIRTGTAPDAPAQRTLAVLQPYFLPYIGYWQLMAAVDEFVVFDDVQFTRRGWIHRNRYLAPGGPRHFSLDLAAGARELAILDRRLAEGQGARRAALRRKVGEAYRGAPFLDRGRAVLDRSLDHEGDDLTALLLHSMGVIRETLGIDTPLVRASTLGIGPELRGAERVLEICRRRGATRYVNPEGGTALYDPARFARAGIELRFLRARMPPYRQFGAPFVPALSILDPLMFLPREEVRAALDAFDLFVPENPTVSG